MPPAARDAVIGVDVGTTAVKVGLYDPSGTEHLVARRDYAMSTSQSGRAEQDAVEVMDAAIDAIGEVVAGARERAVPVVGVGLSTAMHALVGIDHHGAPVTPVITYADGRAADQATRLRADHFDVYRRTGTPLHPMSPLAKLAWFRDHPEATADVHRWVGLKEVLLHRLTGEVLVDAASASATGLYALADGAWDDEALELAGIEANDLAEVVDTTHVVPALDPAVAAATGLDRDTPVVVGATDGVLANLGVAALARGRGAISIGTSGAVRVTVDRPVTDADMATFCYVLAPGRWVVGGAISNGGLWLRWLREALLRDDTTDADLSGLAAEVPAGADGVLVLPYLTGERAPQWSSDLAATVFGLRLHHGRGHVVRAGMEGVAHQLRLVTRAVEGVVGDAAGDGTGDGGTAIERLRATGGFTNSDVWLQIVADVLDVPLELPRASEGVAFGAAMLAMVALGHLPSLDAADDLVEVDRIMTPDPGRRVVHDATHERWVELLDHLDEPYARLAATGRQ